MFAPKHTQFTLISEGVPQAPAHDNPGCLERFFEARLESVLNHEITPEQALEDTYQKIASCKAADHASGEEFATDLFKVIQNLGYLDNDWQNRSLEAFVTLSANAFSSDRNIRSRGIPRAFYDTIQINDFSLSYIDEVRKKIFTQEAIQFEKQQKQNRALSTRFSAVIETTKKKPYRNTGAAAALAGLVAYCSLAGNGAPEPKNIDTQLLSGSAQDKPSIAEMKVDLTKPAVNPGKPALWSEARRIPIAMSFAERDGEIIPMLQMKREDGKWVAVDPLEKNVHERIDPASITKLLAFAVVVEHLLSGKTSNGEPFTLDTKVKLTPRLKAEFRVKEQGNVADEMTVRQLLERGMTLSSNGAIHAATLASVGFKAGDDTQANVEAEKHYSDAASKEMNILAANYIGMKDTNVINTTGQPIYEFMVTDDKETTRLFRLAREGKAGINVMSPNDIALLLNWNMKRFPALAQQFLNRPSVGNFQPSDPVKRFASPEQIEALGLDGAKTGHSRNGYNLVSHWKNNVITVIVGFSDRGKNQDAYTNVGNRCLYATAMARETIRLTTGQDIQYKGGDACPLTKTTVKFSPQRQAQFATPEPAA